MPTPDKEIMAEDLELCPFCGNLPKVSHFPTGKSIVECCGAVNPMSIERWQSRPPKPQPTPPERGEELNEEAMVEWIRSYRDNQQKGPYRLFEKMVYPSSGVEAMDTQERNLRAFAKAIVATFSPLRSVKWPEKKDHDEECGSFEGFKCDCGSGDFNQAIDLCRKAIEQAGGRVE